MNHLVIMAGGIGSRFWPMSTTERPKQFIDVLGVGRTLFQLTYDRFEGICAPENVWVVTNEKYAQLCKEQLPEIPEGNILLEPCRRNTAPCIAYASWRIKKADPKANIVVTPSDHMVIDVLTFRKVVSQCLKFTSESDSIVTLGVKPSRPETGYGYIEADYSRPSARNKDMFPVSTFREKPNLETAQAYLKKNNFLWNAGIFIWSAETIINAFRIYQPSIARIFDRLRSKLGTSEEQQAIREAYPDCDNISVDFAIMEKAEEIFVCPVDFGWSDLGTWGSLLIQSKKDLYGNALISNNIEVYETKNCIINVHDAKKVVVQGLDGYIVAEHDNTLLICKLSEEQRIKQFAGEK